MTCWPDDEACARDLQLSIGENNVYSVQCAYNVNNTKSNNYNANSREYVIKSII